MFSGCEKLSKLDLSSFDTSNVTTMRSMFFECKALKELDVTNFNTLNVESMKYMFVSCESLTTMDLNNFDTSNVTDMESMFNACNSLETIILGKNFDRLYSPNIFSGAKNLTRVISLRPATSASDVMTVSGDAFNNMSASAILYVPNTATESLYEANATYASELGKSRIEPIMELVGANPTTVPLNNTYDASTDLGVKVAGFDPSESSDYTSLGFSVAKSGLPVDTSAEGESTVTYTLNYTNASGETAELSTVTRDIKVVETVDLMARDISYYGDEILIDYMLGAYRANKSYSGEQVTKVIFASEEPEGAVDSWDVSYEFGDNTVISYIVPSKEEDDIQYYDQYIVAARSINISEPKNLFYGYWSATAVENLDYVTTDGATDMSYMFYEFGCWADDTVTIEGLEWNICFLVLLNMQVM